MAGKLTDELQSLVQRSGTNTGRMRTEVERAAFADNVRKDIAAIVYQLNTVYKELVQVLSSEQDLNALDYGLSGNVIYTSIHATAADAEAYWTEDQARARTVKETIDVLLAEIARLENEIQQALDSDEYDDTELRSLIQSNVLDLKQIAYDTMGPNYTLDGDGLPNLSYSVSQALDAVGAFFSGFPSTGNTYANSYPALSLIVALSEITIDTTLDQTVVDGLPADLTAIQTFTGMDSSVDSSPDYSAYGGTLADIADSDSLEEAIWKLDQRTLVDTLQDGYDGGAVGTAGNLQLTNSFGAIRVKDDTSTPLGTLLEWIDSTSTVAGQLTSTGASLAADTWLEMAVSTVGPAASAGVGRLNTRPDGTSADVELYYQNSDGSDGNAQITRDGIVKELEVGHTTVRAAEFLKFAADSGPSLDTYEMSDYVVQMRNFDNQVQENAYTTVPIPLDENNDTPRRVKIIASFLLGPNGGAYPGGAGVAINVQVGTGTGTPSTIAHKQLIDPGWDAALVQTATLLNIAHIDNIIVLEWPVIVLTGSSLGLLNIKVSRDVAHADDDWADDVGLVALQVVWYR